MWEIHQASGWGVNFWGVGSVGNVGSVGKSMIFQHSQCFQCFQCSKKKGTPLKNPPLLRTQFAPNTAQGAHKLHKGETARQGRQHSAGGSAQTPRGRNSTAGATAQRRGSAQTPRGRHSTARATAQESRNEGGRLSEVAALAVTLLALKFGNHGVVHGMKIQVCLLLLLT